MSKKVDMPVYVSFADLALVQPLVDTEGVEYVLHHVFGFDNERVLPNDYLDGQLLSSGGNFFHVAHQHHRSRQGKIVEGDRYWGWERSDNEWLKSNICSDEMKLLSKGDQSLVDEVMALSKRAGWVG